MARKLYGASPADYFIAADGSPVPGATANVYNAITGGSQITDLQNISLVAVTQVVADSFGGFRFYGPDGYTAELWVQAPGGTLRYRVDPSGMATDLAAETTARAAADTAESTARASADTTESTARSSADTTESTTRATADTNEATTRAAADTAETAARVLLASIAKVEVYRNETTGVYPVRPTTARPVTWVGTVAPTLGGTGATDNLDYWQQDPA